MLIYKAWLETRLRFALGLAILVVLCGNTVIGWPGVHKAHPLFPYSRYIYNDTYFALTTVLFLMCAILLGLGGLLREKANGTAWLTLMLPVSHRRLVAARVAVGLAETLVLAFVPPIVICGLSPLVGESYPLTQALQFAMLWMIVGTAYFSLALVISAAVSGEYASVAVAYILFFSYSSLPGRIPALRASLRFHLNVIISGHAQPYLQHATDFLQGPLPWYRLCGVIGIAAVMIAASGHMTQRQDY